MSDNCASVTEGVGTGVTAAMVAVDCEASQVTSQTFGRLFASGGELGLVLTILLTLYVAFFAISLMIGRSNLNVRAMIPRMMTLGLVLTFATSFAAYQSFFWNIFISGPDWLAGVLTGTGRGTGADGSATLVFAQKLDVVFQAVQQVGTTQGNIDAFSPPGMMWMGALLLLLGTVGILVTARIGLALLLAIGPIFVVMALFQGTRGLFTGWLKGLVMLAITPVLAVLGGSIMLELAVPVLATLSQFQGNIDPQAAMAFFLVGAVHCALMLMTFIVSAKMVAGWQVFGFVTSKEDVAKDSAWGGITPRAQPLAPPAGGQPAFLSTAQAAAGATSPAGTRRIDVSASQARAYAGNPANDSGSGGTVRETRVFATSSGFASGGAQVSPLNSSHADQARTRGIGNRFRSASARFTGRGAGEAKLTKPQPSAGRSTEKTA
jgi:type IV secretion system protein VirB6